MTNLTNLKFKDKDGEDDNPSSIRASIETVSNGWILKVEDDETGAEWTEVYSFDSGNSLIDGLKEVLNV